jgi:hypothetical protein
VLRLSVGIQRRCRGSRSYGRREAKFLFSLFEKKMTVGRADARSEDDVVASNTYLALAKAMITHLTYSMAAYIPFVTTALDRKRQLVPYNAWPKVSTPILYGIRPRLSAGTGYAVHECASSLTRRWYHHYKKRYSVYYMRTRTERERERERLNTPITHTTVVDPMHVLHPTKTWFVDSTLQRPLLAGLENFVLLPVI